MTTVYNFRKGDQIERYIGQFMRVFSGFQVQDGVERNNQLLTKRVPVVYGNMSRIVATILNKRDFLTNNRIPMIAANMISLEPDPNNKRSPHHVDIRNVKSPNGAVLNQLSGPAFIMNMELSVYASSTTELFEIVEQILLIFNPRVAIQTSSDLYDSNYITDIALTSIQPEIQYPMGTEQPIVTMSMTFELPIRLKYPRGFSDNIIEQIIANVKTTDDVIDIQTTITGDRDTGEIVIEDTTP